MLLNVGSALGQGPHIPMIQCRFRRVGSNIETVGWVKKESYVQVGKTVALTSPDAREPQEWEILAVGLERQMDRNMVQEKSVGDPVGCLW